MLSLPGGASGASETPPASRALQLSSCPHSQLPPWKHPSLPTPPPPARYAWGQGSDCRVFRGDGPASRSQTLSPRTGAAGPPAAPSRAPFLSSCFVSGSHTPFQVPPPDLLHPPPPDHLRELHPGVGASGETGGPGGPLSRPAGLQLRVPSPSMPPGHPPAPTKPARCWLWDTVHDCAACHVTGPLQSSRTSPTPLGEGGEQGGWGPRWAGSLSRWKAGAGGCRASTCCPWGGGTPSRRQGPRGPPWRPQALPQGAPVGAPGPAGDTDSALLKGMGFRSHQNLRQTALNAGALVLASPASRELRGAGGRRERSNWGCWGGVAPDRTRCRARLLVKGM